MTKSSKPSSSKRFPLHRPPGPAPMIAMCTGRDVVVSAPKGCDSLSSEVVDDRAPEVLARFELLEDVGHVGERAGARHVCLHLARRGEVDELTHLLHGADGR